jgi:hypothetical protein
MNNLRRPKSVPQQRERAKQSACDAEGSGSEIRNASPSSNEREIDAAENDTLKFCSGERNSAKPQENATQRGFAPSKLNTSEGAGSGDIFCTRP